MAHLPGSFGELIGDLRCNKGWLQKELAKRAGFTESALSRIESGITKQVDATALGKIATVMDTSTDYLLGLSKIRTPKHIDIIKLGLSEEAARHLLSPAFNTKGAVKGSICKRRSPLTTYPTGKVPPVYLHFNAFSVIPRITFSARSAE